MSEWAAIAAAVSAAVLFAYAVSSYWIATRGKAARRIRMRLEALTTNTGAAGEATLIKDLPAALNPLLEGLIASIPRAEHVTRLIAQAGLTWSRETFFTATAVCFFVGFFGAFVFTWWLLALAAGAAAAFLPMSYLSRHRAKRMRAFETQFPETLDLISRA